MTRWVVAALVGLGVGLLVPLPARPVPPPAGLPAKTVATRAAACDAADAAGIERLARFAEEREKQLDRAVAALGDALPAGVGADAAEAALAPLADPDGDLVLECGAGPCYGAVLVPGDAARTEAVRARLVARFPTAQVEMGGGELGPGVRGVAFVLLAAVPEGEGEARRARRMLTWAWQAAAAESLATAPEAEPAQIP